MSQLDSIRSLDISRLQSNLGACISLGIQLRIRHTGKYQFKIKTKARTKSSTEMSQVKTRSHANINTRAHQGLDDPTQAQPMAVPGSRMWSHRDGFWLLCHMQEADPPGSSGSWPLV